MKRLCWAGIRIRVLGCFCVYRGLVMVVAGLVWWGKSVGEFELHLIGNWDSKTEIAIET